MGPPPGKWIIPPPQGQQKGGAIGPPQGKGQGGATGPPITEGIYTQVGGIGEPTGQRPYNPMVAWATGSAEPWARPQGKGGAIGPQPAAPNLGGMRAMSLPTQEEEFWWRDISRRQMHALERLSLLSLAEHLHAAHRSIEWILAQPLASPMDSPDAGIGHIRIGGGILSTAPWTDLRFTMCSACHDVYKP